MKREIWKGTVGEAIKEGRLTQEEVDEWEIQDELKEYEKELKGKTETGCILSIKFAENKYEICHCKKFVPQNQSQDAKSFSNQSGERSPDTQTPKEKPLSEKIELMEVSEPAGLTYEKRYILYKQDVRETFQKILEDVDKWVDEEARKLLREKLSDEEIDIYMQRVVHNFPIKEKIKEIIKQHAGEDLI